jgi:hypothetical protein
VCFWLPSEAGKGGKTKKFMMRLDIKSKIEVNSETGKKSLIIHYDLLNDDFDAAINQVLAHHGFEQGEITVIALPNGQGERGRMVERYIRWGSQFRIKSPPTPLEEEIDRGPN